MPPSKQKVGAHTKARSIGEFESARNMDVTIYPSFLRSPSDSKEDREDAERDAYLIFRLTDRQVQKRL